MPRAYVDNAYNRRIGRVGMPLGSMVVSKGVPGTSVRTYVDNAQNRNLGRVGMFRGSMPVGWHDDGYGIPTHHQTKTHQDVTPSVPGEIKSTRGRSARPKSPAFENASSSEHKPPTASCRYSRPDAEEARRYVDNPLNRLLGRVGQEVGTAVRDKHTRAVADKRYADNPENRRLGRVGLPKGAWPERNKHRADDSEQARLVHEELAFGDDPEQLRSFMADFTGLPETSLERSPPRLGVRPKASLRQPIPQADKKQHAGVAPNTTNIESADLHLRRMIGHGSLADVYLADWKDMSVAAKKYRGSKMSKKRARDFVKEIAIFCQLRHSNVVKIYGACVESPNMCVVMERMQTTLFEALHVTDVITFEKHERLDVIYQACSGLRYLHENYIPHGDLKSLNILIDFEKGYICNVKLSDFGLAMIKSNYETQSSSVDATSRVTSARYAAPEVLRGSFLSPKDMIKADVYSAGIIILEVAFNTEPFYEFTLRQLEKQVGEDGRLPAIPHGDSNYPVSADVIMELVKTWSFDPASRPTARDLQIFFEQSASIYEHGSNLHGIDG